MMQAPDGWPVLPDVSANDPQAEVKKARYQAILQAEVGKRQLALDETRANLQFQLDQAKARLQLDLDKSKAAAAARIAEAAARLQLQLDKQKALDVIVEGRAEERRPEYPDGNLPELESPKGRK